MTQDRTAAATGLGRLTGAALARGFTRVLARALACALTCALAGTLAAALTIAGASASAAQDQPPKPDAAGTGSRLAFVAGIDGYEGQPLEKAATDAAVVAAALTKAGFAVTGMRNTTQDMLRAQFRAFIAKVAQAGSDAAVVVYISGYGLQTGGQNFLVPLKAQIATPGDLPLSGVRLGDLLLPLGATPAKVKTVFFDLAWRGPFPTADKVKTAGLAKMTAEAGMAIMFNASPGSVAPPAQGSIGHFAAAIGRAVGAGADVPVKVLLARIETDVVRSSKLLQVPWGISRAPDGVSITGEPASAPQAGAAPSGTTPPGTTPPGGAPSNVSGAGSSSSASGPQDGQQGGQQGGQPDAPQPDQAGAGSSAPPPPPAQQAQPKPDAKPDAKPAQRQAAPEPDAEPARPSARTAYNRARRRGTSALRQFIEDYPDSPYTARARRLIEQRSEPPSAWRAAITRDSVESYRAYLARYPRGRRASEARRRIRVMLRERAGSPPERAAPAAPVRRYRRGTIANNCKTATRTCRTPGPMKPGRRCRCYYPDVGKLFGVAVP